MIRLEAVSKYFDDRAAVEEVSFEVEEHSIFGLVGPNGAGKTTTLKMLATLIKPDAGALTMCGVDLGQDARAARRLLGYMPDTFGTFRGLSCAEYLAFFGRCYGITGDDLARRVEGVLELTDLGTRRDEATASLSTGLKQRLALAKTILHDPEVLLLDEPASGLDPRARIEIRELLKELRRMGKTIVISSHILADLEEICTHIGIIDGGRIAWHGSMEVLKQLEGEERWNYAIQLDPARAAEAERLLLALPSVRAARVSGGGLEVECHGHPGNELLAALLAGGIEVIAFARKEQSLEAAFLARTTGIRG